MCELRLNGCSCSRGRYRGGPIREKRETCGYVPENEESSPGFEESSERSYPSRMTCANKIREHLRATGEAVATLTGTRPAATLCCVARALVARESGDRHSGPAQGRPLHCANNGVSWALVARGSGGRDSRPASKAGKSSVRRGRKIIANLMGCGRKFAKPAKTRSRNEQSVVAALDQISETTTLGDDDIRSESPHIGDPLIYDETEAT
jgi:hypothetical protein